MEEKIKHLEMIQGVINRMANNSFILKGWAVTLAAGIFALPGSNSESVLSWIGCIPIIAFWGLDTYYLLQERLYRSLYKKVCALDNADIDFSMIATKDVFPDKKNRYLSCLASGTESLFYLPLTALYAIMANIVR